MRGAPGRALQGQKLAQAQISEKSSSCCLFAASLLCQQGLQGCENEMLLVIKTCGVEYSAGGRKSRTVASFLRAQRAHQRVPGGAAGRLVATPLGCPEADIATLPHNLVCLLYLLLTAKNVGFTHTQVRAVDGSPVPQQRRAVRPSPEQTRRTASEQRAAPNQRKLRQTMYGGGR